MNVAELIAELCELEAPPAPDEPLGALLDSLAFIELLDALEDAGYEIHPTRVDRSRFASVREIETLLDEMKNP